MASQDPFPLMPPKSTELRLAHFDDYVYTATPSTALYKYLDALCGTTGAGALVNEIFLARMAGALETIYYNDLDYIFSKVSFLSRSPAESYPYNPMVDLLTSDQWDDVRAKDAWFRSRIKDFFKACSLGGTPDGVRMCVLAALAVDCDIYEVWRYKDNFGLANDLGRSPHTARNELVVQPLKGSLAPEELRLVRDMLGKICPVDTIVTVNLKGLAVMSPVSINAAAADSTYYEVQRMVTATPVLAQMPPPELLPIDLLPTETWLYDAQTDPQLAPYAAFNISSEYGYYYLTGGGSRSPIDSVTYGTINPNKPIQVTVFEVSGTYELLDGIPIGPTSDAFFESNLDPTFFRWVRVPYPGDLYPMASSIAQGVAVLINMINALPGPFVLVGYSQGAAVISNVYDQLRNGSLKSRRGDLLAGLAYGNPRRQAGQIFPRCPDPGGHGIWAHNLLSGTEPLWWEFANSGDIISAIGDDPVGQDTVTVFEWLLGNYTGVLSLIEGIIFNPLVALTVLGQAVLNAVFSNNNHARYMDPNYHPVPGDTRNPIDIGRDYISTLKVDNLAALAAREPVSPAYPVIAYEVADPATPNYFSTHLDPRIRYIKVPWAQTALPMGNAVNTGVANLTNLINSNSGKFVLIGSGEGAIVTSKVYDQIRAGSLQSRRADLVAGVAFGNPRRQAGHIFTGGSDPGGHGISADRLSATESLWWEFANDNDLLTTVTDSGVGPSLTMLFDAFQDGYTGDPGAITGQFPNQQYNYAQLMTGITNVVFNQGPGSSHTAYSLTAPLGDSGDPRTSFEIARDYLNTFAAEIIPPVLPTLDPMQTYQTSPNYQTFDTTGHYTPPTPYEKADSPDNYPGGKYGIHPATAPALNPDGTAYIFAWDSQAALVAAKTVEVLAAGGVANDISYQMPLSITNSSPRIFYPDYAIAYYPPAKESTVSSSLTARRDSGTQISTEVRDPVNFVR